MKIVVLADTHMPRMAKKLPARLLSELANADAIIHAGDWTSLSVYEQLAAFAPTYGVAGNNDGEEIQAKFGLRRLLQFGPWRIGIVHGHGAARRASTESHAIAAFKDTPVNLIIYGHSHIPVLKRVDDLIVFNPGSPTDKRRQPLYSFGIIDFQDTEQQPIRHIFYSDKS
ncbi:metallophosphoesterase family protein [Paenibacillus paeoniae]|uniref:Phosphoesterase n=1 Tax=Paenibacillus paeoniae TaxID=2292705 RepID=A0A371PNA7_9BACL|nr:metallophosphoesterase [Paenibacillus paeoniae]REK77613.1 metallophosphoesterase [Paenibacillus paeoniae]